MVGSLGAARRKQAQFHRSSQPQQSQTCRPFFRPLYAGTYPPQRLATESVLSELMLYVGRDGILRPIGNRRWLRTRPFRVPWVRVAWPRRAGIGFELYGDAVAPAVFVAGDWVLTKIPSRCRGSYTGRSCEPVQGRRSFKIEYSLPRAQGDPRRFEAAGDEFRTALFRIGFELYNAFIQAHSASIPVRDGLVRDGPAAHEQP